MPHEFPNCEPIRCFPGRDADVFAHILISSLDQSLLGRASRLLSGNAPLFEEDGMAGKRRDALAPRMARFSESFNSELSKIRCLERIARSRRRYGKSVPYKI